MDLMHELLFMEWIPANSPRPLCPTRRYQDDAGLDLYVLKDVWLWPFITTDLPTGWRVKVPNGHVGLVLPRSSTFKNMHIAVHSGVIDASYSGELSVLVRNLSPWPRKIKRDARLAQLLVVPCVMRRPQVTKTLPVTERGMKGFGSTGYNKL